MIRLWRRRRHLISLNLWVHQGIICSFNNVIDLLVLLGMAGGKVYRPEKLMHWLLDQTFRNNILDAASGYI